MAHPYHHALSSVKKWGGSVEDYLALHEFFDASKLILADFRHRALRHHAEGIFLLEQIHGIPQFPLVLSRTRLLCDAGAIAGTAFMPGNGEGRSVSRLVVLDGGGVWSPSSLLLT
jgi:hypothetical protein